MYNKWVEVGIRSTIATHHKNNSELYGELWFQTKVSFSDAMDNISEHKSLLRVSATLTREHHSGQLVRSLTTYCAVVPPCQQIDTTCSTRRISVVSIPRRCCGVSRDSMRKLGELPRRKREQASCYRSFPSSFGERWTATARTQRTGGYELGVSRNCPRDFVGNPRNDVGVDEYWSTHPSDTILYTHPSLNLYVCMRRKHYFCGHLMCSPNSFV